MPPERRPFRELPLQTVSEYSSVQAVKGALRELEQGIFTRAAQLVDAMGRDSRVKPAMRTRVNGLLGCPVEFEPRGDGRRGRAVAKDVEKWFWKAFPEHALADLKKWGLQLGLGVGELLWERGARRWDVKLRVWHPQWVQWRWDTRSYWIHTETGPVEITPGDGKWVLYTPYGYERGWMEGLVRALAIPWLIRQWAYRDWARYSEVHGLPIKKATTPTEATEEDKDAFFDDLRDMAQEGLIVVPKNREGHGYDFDLIEATAKTHEGFQELLGETASDIAIVVLGQNLTTEVKQGSRAAAQVHDEVRLDLKEFDAEALGTCLHDQALEPWARWNLGDAELAPYPGWQTAPPADRKLEAETLDKLGDALGKLKNAGLNVDVEAIADAHSIPLVKGQPTTEPDEDEPEYDEDETEEPEEEELAARPKAPRGMREGLAYADRVADAARDEAARVLAPDVEALLAAIDAAESFEGLRAELPKLLAGMDPSALAEVITNADLLAHLAGRRAVRRDL